MSQLVENLCACGCGQPTNIVKHARWRKGYTAGDHYRFLLGHGGQRHREPRLPFQPADLAPTTSELSRRLHVDRTQLYRWKTYGVTVAQAETIADRLGRHPTELWGHTYYETAGCQ